MLMGVYGFKNTPKPSSEKVKVMEALKEKEQIKPVVNKPATATPNKK